MNNQSVLFKFCANNASIIFRLLGNTFTQNKFTAALLAGQSCSRSEFTCFRMQYCFNTPDAKLLLPSVKYSKRVRLPSSRYCKIINNYDSILFNALWQNKVFTKIINDNVRSFNGESNRNLFKDAIRFSVLFLK